MFFDVFLMFFMLFHAWLCKIHHKYECFCSKPAPRKNLFFFMCFFEPFSSFFHCVSYYFHVFMCFNACWNGFLFPGVIQNNSPGSFKATRQAKTKGKTITRIIHNDPRDHSKCCPGSFKTAPRLFKTTPGIIHNDPPGSCKTRFGTIQNKPRDHPKQHLDHSNRLPGIIQTDPPGSFKPAPGIIHSDPPGIIQNAPRDHSKQHPGTRQSDPRDHSKRPPGSFKTAPRGSL